MNVEDTWQLGWRGITADVPLPWALSKVEGTAESGYLRLDDESMPRLELRWGPSPGRKKSLADLTENYLKQARKLARKMRVPFDYSHRQRFFPAKGREVCYLTLQSDYASHIIVSRCKQCGRIVLARILHQPGEDVAATVAMVFGSLRDHAYQGEITWSVFDLRARLPETFDLISSTFQVGQIRLAFRRGKDRLVLDRHNFARELLRETNLKHWLVYSLRKELRPFVISSDEWQHRGHEGVLLSGSLKLWRRLMTLDLKPRRLSALAWRCDESDRLFAIRLLTRKPDDEELARLAKSMECHERSD